MLLTVRRSLLIACNATRRRILQAWGHRLCSSRRDKSFKSTVVPKVVGEGLSADDHARQEHTRRVVEQSKQSQERALFATGAGAGANLFLFVSKGIAGYSVGSTALIADCLGSLGDMCTDAIVYYSVKEAREAATADRPWGRGKMEPIGAFIVSGVLGLTGAGIGYSALGVIWEMMQTLPIGSIDWIPAIFGSGAQVAPIAPSDAESLVDGAYSAVGGQTPASTEMVFAALGVSAMSMAIKEWLYRYTVKAGMLANSAAVVANAWQHRSDVMVSAAVFCGMAGAHAGYPILDPAVAVLVAGIIMKQAYAMGGKSLRDLSDAPASKQETDALTATVLAIKGIETVQDLKARQSGPFLYVECTVGVAGQLSASTAHRLAELVKRKLKNEHADRVANAIVHVVPLGSAGLGEKTGSNTRSHIFIRTEVIRVLLEKSSAAARSAQSSPDTADTADSEYKGLSNITSVEEVQVYYRDDGRVSLKIDVAMNPHITIREAHTIAVLAAKLIHSSIEGVADVDVDLELDEGAWGPGGRVSGMNVKTKLKKEDS